MKIIYKISLAINFLILGLMIYLAFNGTKIVKDIVFNQVISVRKKQKESMFRATPISKGAIVFVGNSITEGGNWDELFPDKVILNRGIGGDVTEGVLNRLDEIIRHQPSKIFICIGTNDIAKGLTQEEILSNYSQILESLKSKLPDTKIYIQSILPVGDKVIFGHSNKRIIPLNKALEKLSSDYNLTYIDLHPFFIDKNGCLKSECTNDKLHLLGEGYLIWKKIIEPYINE